MDKIILRGIIGMIIFYIVNEILDGLLKKDKLSHLGHIIGAICGGIFGFLYFYNGGNLFI